MMVYFEMRRWCDVPTPYRLLLIYLLVVAYDGYQPCARQTFWTPGADAQLHVGPSHSLDEEQQCGAFNISLYMRHDSLSRPTIGFGQSKKHKLAGGDCGFSTDLLRLTGQSGSCSKIQIA